MSNVIVVFMDFDGKECYNETTISILFRKRGMGVKKNNTLLRNDAEKKGERE